MAERLSGHRIGWREHILEDCDEDFDYMHYRPTQGVVRPPVDVLERTHATRRALAEALVPWVDGYMAEVWDEEHGGQEAVPLVDALVRGFNAVLGEPEE